MLATKNVTRLPIASAPRQRVSAAARIIAKPCTTGDQPCQPSAISSLYQQGSARIRFPRTEPGALQAVLLNTAGGLTGDDHIQWTAGATNNAHLNISTAACEKVYRTHGPAAIQTTMLEVADGARLEWLPQETILFSGARLDRSMTVQLDETADALIGESLVFGRQAMRESVDNIRLRDRWRVYRAGRLLHAEDLLIDTRDHDNARHVSMLHHFSAASTVVLISNKPDEWFNARVNQLRQLPCPGIEHIRLGISVLPSRLVIRVLASDSFQLRKILIPCIELLNDGRRIPVVWNV